MRSLPASVVAGALALLLVALTLVSTWSKLPNYEQPDSSYYQQLAEGQPEEVIKPFSTRLLHPAMVRGLSEISGLSIEQSFLWVGIASLVVLLITVSLLLRQHGVFPLLMLPVLYTPFLWQLFSKYYIPDSFHAALLALFFLAFTYRRSLALLVLFLLFMARESTVLLSVCLVLFGVVTSDKKLIVQTLLMTVLSWVLLSIFETYGQPNIHALNSILYMLFKLLYNFAHNILGLEFWADTYAAYNPRFCQPVWTMDVPSWIPSGSVQNVGICEVRFSEVLETAYYLLLTFGILPTLVLVWLIKHRKTLRTERGLHHLHRAWFGVALIYGMVAFALGTVTGGAVYRLVGYGWPAFWLAAPVLLMDAYETNRKLFGWLVALQALVVWLPWITPPFLSGVDSRDQQRLVLVGVALVAHIVAAKLATNIPLPVRPPVHPRASASSESVLKG
jgi:hypothetical protein